MRDYEILYGSLEDYCKAVGLTINELIEIKESEIRLMKRNYIKNYVDRLEKLNDEELKQAFMIRERIDEKTRLLNRLKNYQMNGGKEIWQ